MEYVFKIAIALVSLVIVLYLIYFTAKYLSKKVTYKKGGLMRIVDVLPLSSDSLLIIVKIANKFILLGKTQKNITFLKEFDKSELIENEEGFKKIIEEKTGARSNNILNKISDLYTLFKDKSDGE